MFDLAWARGVSFLQAASFASSGLVNTTEVPNRTEPNPASVGLRWGDTHANHTGGFGARCSVHAHGRRRGSELQESLPDTTFASSRSFLRSGSPAGEDGEDGTKKRLLASSVPEANSPGPSQTSGSGPRRPLLLLAPSLSCFFLFSELSDRCGGKPPSFRALPAHCSSQLGVCGHRPAALRVHVGCFHSEKTRCRNSTQVRVRFLQEACKQIPSSCKPRRQRRS